MKKLILIITIIFSGTLLQAQSKTGVDWNMSTEELLVKENDNIVKDSSSNNESSFSFDTIALREIRVKKIFWNTKFEKKYFFENEKLFFIQTQVKEGEVNYDANRANLSTYRIYYIKMYDLLISKYGEPTNKNGLDFFSMDRYYEILDNEEDLAAVCEWVLPDETIVLAYSYYDSLDLIYWTLEYTLNFNRDKVEQKKKQVEILKKEEEQLELKQKQEESNKLLNDI